MESFFKFSIKRQKAKTGYHDSGTVNALVCEGAGALSAVNEREKLESFRDIYDRFTRNAQGFWEAYHALLVIFLMGLLCDAAGTMHFMITYGIEFEIHPFVRWVSFQYGPVVGPLVGVLFKFTLGLIVSIYCRKSAVWIFSSVSVISFLAGWYNVLALPFYVDQMAG